jgi:dihydroorotate dehydrogenase (fumarate)
MADLRTKYLGVELQNPVVVGASPLSNRIDTIKEIEAAGAGALVIRSLFEEQIQRETAEFEEQRTKYDGQFNEAVDLFPKLEHGGPREHLYWVSKTREEVTMPLFASLNAVTEQVWVEHARQLAETGVDGLEINFYSPPLDANISADEMEKREIDIFARVRDAVKIPIAVKLHPFYTNMYRTALAFDRLGADGLVLFNRLFQPDIDIGTQAEESPTVISSKGDYLVPLRWIALLHGKVKASLIGNTGVLDGHDAVRMILAGADAVQVVSAVYKRNIGHIRTMLDQLSGWMDEKRHDSLDDFRGKVSRRGTVDVWSFHRGQYIQALLSR